MSPRALATLIFAQMLPATLLAPAVRPLLAGAGESAMHAFMSVNMAGAVLAAPFVARARVDLLRPLLLIDGVLIAALCLPLPVEALLGLRFLEGGAHVGAATLLLARGSALAEERGTGRIMGLCGGAVMAAVAAGSFLGGQLVVRALWLPFVLGGAVELLVLLFAGFAGPRPAPRPRATCAISRDPSLRAPMAFAFAGRFTVGCLVVSFSLLAHRVHGLSDATVGALFASFTLPFAALTYPMGKLADRLGSFPVLVPGALAWAAALPLLGVAPTWALFVLMPAGGVASAAIFAPTLRLAARAEGADRPAAMAAVNAAGAAGMLVGPPAAGILSAFVGGGPDAWRAAFAMGALVLLSCVLVYAREATPVRIGSPAR